MSTNPLSVDVYVAPMRPFAGAPAEQERVEGIVSAMLELHDDRDNPRVLWHSARAAVAARG